MRILHICQGYFDSSFYKHFMNSTQELGIENIIYIPQNESDNNENDNSILISKNTYNLIERLLFFGKQNKSQKEIEKNIILNDIDIIFAHNLFSGGYVAYNLSRKYNIPYLVAVRNTDLNFFYKYMIHLRGIGHKIIKNATNVIFISLPYKTSVISGWYNGNKIIEEKSKVIPNGLSPFFMENIHSDNKKVTNSGQIRLLYFGEITANKNIETSIKVCRRLIEMNHKVEFTIIGEIKYEKFHQLLKDNDFITYLSHCPREKLIEQMKYSDIFIMPSFKETFGLVYTEALSQGLPIIYTIDQGYDGFFEQGEVGYAVNPSNYQEITDCILKIYDNYEAISKNCKQGAKRFDWKIIAKKYQNIYNNILCPSK